MSQGESVGVVSIPSHGLRFTINGKEIKTPPLAQPTGPRHMFVDIYGPVTAVEVLPVQWRVSDSLRLGTPPREMTRASQRDCHYFKICRRFLWAQRSTIAGQNVKVVDQL